jgi:hypothetical protein
MRIRQIAQSVISSKYSRIPFLVVTESDDWTNGTEIVLLFHCHQCLDIIPLDQRCQSIRLDCSEKSERARISRHKA